MPWGASLDPWALIGESPVSPGSIEEENSPDWVPQCTNFLQLPLAALLPLLELSPFSWITWHLSHCGVAAICRYLSRHQRQTVANLSGVLPSSCSPPITEERFGYGMWEPSSLLVCSAVV
ncbi:unnamed protein product, partial [Cyprideis torosa]